MSNRFDYNGHTYELVTTAMKWSDADQAARERGGYLAVIESAGENTAVYNNLLLFLSIDYPTADDGGDARYVWLGATDAASEGVWLWSSGVALGAYSNWGSGLLGQEPDNFDGDQDALAMALSQWPFPQGGLGVGGQWNDLDDNNRLYAVVEFDGAATGGGLTLTGTSGDDSLIGDSGNDVLSGEAGNDILEGGAGDDVLDGGDGRRDAVSYRNAAGSVTVDLSDGVASGADGSDQIENVERIFGSAFDDALTGDSGDNAFNGLGGNDVIDGKSGHDFASYSEASGGVTVNLLAGTVSGPDGHDTLVDIEGLIGSDHDDVLTGDGRDNWLGGGQGNDQIDGGEGDDTAFFTGARSQYTFSLVGGGIQMVGPDGTDFLTSIEQLAFSEDAFLTVEIIPLTGRKLRGTSFADRLEGTDEDETFEGGEGDDTLNGGDGDDTAIYTSARARVVVNLLLGVASGGDGEDVLNSIENLEGSLFDDDLIGNGRANRLTGNAGADLLEGGGGNDTLDGGRGADTLRGQLGADRYVVDDTRDVVIETDNTPEAPENGFDIGSHIDTVQASITYTLTNYVEVLELAAGAGDINGTGNELDNLLTGNEGNNELQGGGGNDEIDGNEGIDTAIYSNNRSDYQISNTNQIWTVAALAGSDGTDTLANIERLRFADSSLALDLLSTGNAGQTLEFIGALAFDLVEHSETIGVVLRYFDEGYTLQSISELAVAIGLTAELAGSPSDAALAQLVYRNVVGTEADATMTDLLVSYMDGRVDDYSQGEFLAAIAGLELNQQHINLSGLLSTGVGFLPYAGDIA